MQDRSPLTKQIKRPSARADFCRQLAKRDPRIVRDIVKRRARASAVSQDPSQANRISKNLPTTPGARGRRLRHRIHWETIRPRPHKGARDATGLPACADCSMSGECVMSSREAVCHRGAVNAQHSSQKQSSDWSVEFRSDIGSQVVTLDQRSAPMPCLRRVDVLRNHQGLRYQHGFPAR